MLGYLVGVAGHSGFENDHAHAHDLAHSHDHAHEHTHFHEHTSHSHEHTHFHEHTNLANDAASRPIGHVYNGQLLATLGMLLLGAVAHVPKISSFLLPGVTAHAGHDGHAGHEHTHQHSILADISLVRKTSYGSTAVALLLSSLRPLSLSAPCGRAG